MDSNLVTRVNVDAYCPKIRRNSKMSTPTSAARSQVFGRWKLLSTRYTDNPSAISTALNRGRLVTSIRRDTTASEPTPKDICFSLHSPFIHGGRQNKLSSSEIDVG